MISEDEDDEEGDEEDDAMNGNTAVARDGEIDWSAMSSSDNDEEE